MKLGGVMLAAVLLASGGCASEGDYRRLESSSQDWHLPGPDRESAVFGPMPYDQIKAFVDGKEAEGWRVSEVEPGGLFLEGCYLVVMKRWNP